MNQALFFYFGTNIHKLDRLTHSEQIRQFSKLELLARQVVEGFITGLHKSPFHGFSVEFAEHRLYNTGESTRHIDWKLFARSDKLFVKRYEEETNLRCQIVIDRSSSMYYPEGSQNKLNFAIQSAAALTHLFKTQRDAIGLSLFSDKVEEHTPARLSAPHLHYIYDKLEEISTDTTKEKKTSAVEALHEIAERISRRSVVTIFSDMVDPANDMEEIFSALQHLRFNKHEVILFHVVDKDSEIDLQFENRPHTFIDLESGEKIKLNPRNIQEQYQKAAEEHAKTLKIKCGQLSIDYVEADIKKGFNDILMAYLIKRSKIS